ncbi:MAG: tetratricopeptide repeat protein, partial [Planctomycetota bacterium]
MSIQQRLLPLSFTTLVLGSLLHSPLYAEEATEPTSAMATSDEKLKEAGSPEAAKLFAEAGDLQNAGEYEQALQSWKAFLSQHGDDPLALDAHHYVGICLLQKQAYGPAIKQFGKVLADTENEQLHEEALVSLAWCHYSLGAQRDLDQRQIQKAAEYFQRHAEAYPDSATIDDSYFYLGESLNLLSDFAGAADAYAVVIEQHPSSTHLPNALISAAFVNRSAGRYQQAVACYQRLAKEFPSEAQRSDARLNYADALAAMQRVAAAQSVFAQLAREEDQPTLQYVLFRQGSLLDHRERYEEAAEVFQAHAKRFADSETAGSASLNAGRNYLSAHQWGSAKQALQQAIDRPGAHQAGARHWMCHLYLKQGQLAEAVQLARAASEIADLTPVEALRAKLDLAEAEAIQSGVPGDLFASFDEMMTDSETDVPAAERQMLVIRTAIRTALATQSTDEVKRYGRLLLEKVGDHPQAAGVERLVVDHLIQDGDFAAAAQWLAGMVGRYPDHPQREFWQMQLAASRYRTGEFELAVEAAEKLLNEKTLDTIDPSEAYCIAGAAWLELGQAEKAAHAFEAGLQASPRINVREKMLIQLAEARQAMGKHAAAREALETLLEDTELATNPELEQPVRLALAGLAGITGDRTVAQQMYDQLQLVHQPQAAPIAAELQRGWLAMQHDDAAAAAETFTNILASPDASTDEKAAAYYGRAWARCEQDQIAEAHSDLKRYFEQPDSEFREDALQLQSECAIAAKDWSTAEQALRTLISDFPENDRIEDAMGRQVAALIRLNRLDDAKRAAGELADRFATSSWLSRGWHAIGDGEFEAGEFDAAADSYFMAVQSARTPEQAENASYRRGWALFQASQYTLASSVFDAQAKAHPDGPLVHRAHFMQAESQFKLKQHAEALALYETLVTGETLRSELAVLALLHGSECYRSLSQPARAASYLERISKQYPDSVYLAKSIYELGNTYLVMEQPARAIEQFVSATRSGKVEIRLASVISAADICSKSRAFRTSLSEKL